MPEIMKNRGHIVKTKVPIKYTTHAVKMFLQMAFQFSFRPISDYQISTISNEKMKKTVNISNCPQDKIIKICAVLLFCVLHRFARGPSKSSFSCEQTALLKFCSNTPGQLMNLVMAESLCRFTTH